AANAELLARNCRRGGRSKSCEEVTDDCAGSAGITPAAASTDTVGNPAAGGVVRREFKLDRIARNNANEVLAHLTGDVCRNHMAVSQFHAKLCIGQRLLHLAFYFDQWFLCHEHPSNAAVRLKTTPRETGAVSRGYIIYESALCWQRFSNSRRGGAPV